MCGTLSKSDSIGPELKALNHLMQRRMLSAATASGIDKITVMHGWIIGYLFENRGRDIYQKDIESEFAISRSTVTNILKLMEKKGYIIRISVESDARLKKISLTDEGLKTNKIIRQKIEDNELYFRSLLTGEEIKTFLFLIRKLRKGLEQSEPVKKQGIET